MRVVILMMAAVLTLSACGERNLRDMRTANGTPDDFSVLPSRPLQMPQSLAALPAPTPGGSNLTDPTPNADAIVALGGRPSANVAGGVPAGDAALVASVSRYGVQSNIRAELAANDAAFRARKSRGGFFNFLGRDRYFSSYARQALDAYAALAQFRALGVATPTAPPAE